MDVQGARLLVLAGRGARDESRQKAGGRMARHGDERRGGEAMEWSEREEDRKQRK